MKNEKEVKEWLKNHKTNDDTSAIFAFIEGAGIDLFDVATHAEPNAPKATFYEFKEWFEGDTVSEAMDALVDLSKSYCVHEMVLPILDKAFADIEKVLDAVNEAFSEQPTPTFKVGDKVRIKKERVGLEWTIVEVIMPTEENKAVQYKLVRPSDVEGHRVVQCVREGKIEKVVSEQVFRVGDWVRCSRTDKVFRIGNVGYEGYNKTFYVEDDNRLSYRHIKPYQPKEGEFYYVEGNVVSSYIVCGEYMCFAGIASETKPYCYKDKLHTRRPATKKEKKRLIKAVEEEGTKTYCEETKEWVDVKEESKCHSVVPTLSEMTFEQLNITFDTLEKFCVAKQGPSNADRFRQITEGMADLYERKNKDYGNSFSKGIERRGFGSAVDRLYDKVDRLNQLLVENKTAEVKDESVIDTLRDLANYSVMTILEVENRNRDKQCD